ncbi:MAG TPA: DUF1801 domain-containing protein [Candidatus Bilamarchaeum sp.]|nr:DUF1801 domain-containing protein [Candidatus Bilamarchaeum sp.]
MASSASTTVEEYLSGLPPKRRAVISEVRKMILRNLPPGYEERMQYGMIVYVVPLATWPQTFNGLPLAVAALAAQKNHFSLYLMSVYGDERMREWFVAEYAAGGKKPDLGKSCIRFRRLEDLPLEVIGKAIARVPVGDYIAIYEKNRPKNA